jgi:hypothetical protein
MLIGATIFRSECVTLNNITYLGKATLINKRARGGENRSEPRYGERNSEQQKYQKTTPFRDKYGQENCPVLVTVEGNVTQRGKNLVRTRF